MKSDNLLQFSNTDFLKILIKIKKENKPVEDKSKDIRFSHFLNSKA